MAANAALMPLLVQDLLLRTTAAEALGAQLLQQQAASTAQIAEQAGMLGQLEQDNAALVAQLADNIRYSDAANILVVNFEFLRFSTSIKKV